MRCAGTEPGLARVVRSACAALLFVAFGEGTASAETVRLEELEAVALARRGSLSAARARIAGARSGVDVAKAPSRPTLMGELSGEAAPGGRLVRVADQNGDEYLVQGSRALGEEGALIPDLRYGAGLSLAGRLFDFGRTDEAVRAARAELGATRLDERAERRAVLRDVDDAYLDWLSAVGARDVARRRAESARALRESAEGLGVEGAASGAEAEPARHDEARAALELERAETDVVLSRLALERATGRALPPNAEPDLRVLEVAPPSPSREDDPEPAALRRRAEALSAQAAAHRATARPILSGVVELGVRGQTENVFPLYRVGVELSVPIAGGGIESASAEMASARADEFFARASDARAQAALERERLRQSLEHAVRELVLVRRLVELARTSLSREEERLALGSGDRRAVIEARLRHHQAELELLAARVKRARAILALSSGRTR
jgi:outer membrane protein TolC